MTEHTTLQNVDAWLPFADALRRTAPAGTGETVFDGTIGRSSWGGRTLDDGDAVRRHADRSKESRDLLRDAVQPLMRAVDRTVGVRLRVAAGGDVGVRLVEVPQQVEFAMSSGLKSVVLVPDAVPEPYRRTPVDHGRPVSQAADPDAVTTVVRAAMPDARGVSAGDLHAVELDLGRSLPPDVRALFLAANAGELILPSSDDDDGLFYGLRIIALDDAEDRAYLAPLARSLSFGNGATEVMPRDPAGRVQPLATSPAWFAVGDDWGGNFYVVDLAPGPNGTYGQVLFVDHEMLSGARWIAASITELLTQRPVDLAPAGDAAGLSVWQVSDVSDTTEVLRLAKRSDAADLSAIAQHPRLRSLAVDPGKATGLDVVTQLPALEYLALDASAWQTLVDADRVPSGLLCAGFTPLHGSTDADAQLVVANTLLARWNQPTIKVTDLSGSLTPSDPDATQPGGPHDSTPGPSAGMEPEPFEPTPAAATPAAPDGDPASEASLVRPWWRRIFRG